MFVELIESLRCPRQHDEAPLIAQATRTEARHIVDGTLGCPVCGSEYSIEAGVARFGTPAAPTPLDAPTAEEAMRLAAFLELSDARGFALIAGRWGSQADQVSRISQTPLVLVNPPNAFTGDVAARIETLDLVPFAPGAARAAAVDELTPPALVAALARAVRPGGRVLGPVSVSLPPGVAEIVRDERVWVAETNAAPGGAPRLVSLERKPR